MFHSIILRGASASAPMFAFISSMASGQEALPSIDIGAAATQGVATGDGSGGTGRDGKKNDSGTSYTTTNASSALKANIPILDMPRSVVVVPKQVLEDAAVLNVQDAVKFVSGVQQGLGQYYDSFLIRGFSNGNNTYRNGLKLFSIAGTEDPAFIDRIEIIKGPAAMLYGRIQPGGLINYVTKRPQAEAAHSIEEQFGSWGLSRTTVDLTGPVTEDKTVLYRLMGVYDRADDFIDFRHRSNGSLSGEISWRPTTHFEANVGLEYNNFTTTNRGYYAQQIPVLALPYALPWVVGRPAYLPRNWTQNDPNMYNQLPDVIERVTLSADWTYRFNDQWKVTNRFLYSHNDEDQQYVLWRAFNVGAGNMTRRVSWSQVLRDNWSINLDVAGEVNTGSLKHNLLFGFDYFDYRHLYQGDNPPNKIVPEVPLLNIWNPIYAGVNFPFIKGQEIYAHSSKGRSKQKDYGYYFQDDISYSDTIHLLLGARYDIAFDAASEYSFTSTGPCFPYCDGHFNPPWKGNQWERKVSPNAGLLFKITPEYSIYSSFSQSFANSNPAARSFDSRPFAPEQAWQYEVGAKASLFDGKLNGSVAAYELHRTNVLSPDPAHPTFSVATGEVRSRGVELDVSGQVTENISIIGSYTYDDVIIIKDSTTGTAAIVGKRWAGVPRHSGNLWAKYDTAPGQKEAWVFAAGFFANGERQGNNANSWQLPGYVTFDTMIGYRTVVEGFPIEGQFNVKNIGDAKYFEGSDGGANAYYGQPRTFIGSLKVKF